MVLAYRQVRLIQFALQGSTRCLSIVFQDEKGWLITSKVSVRSSAKRYLAYCSTDEVFWPCIRIYKTQRWDDENIQVDRFCICPLNSDRSDTGAVEGIVKGVVGGVAKKWKPGSLKMVS
jgi:hypothetical protein